MWLPVSALTSPQPHPLNAAAAQLFVFLGEKILAVVLGALVAAFAELLAGLHVVPLYKHGAWPALSAG